MKEYKLFTDKFGLSDKSVHFLRGSYNYETLDYLLVDSFILDKGPQINNWLIALVIGLILVIVPAYVILISIIKKEIHLTGMGIELTILPIFMGFYAIYQSLKRGFVFKVIHNNKTICFPIEQLKKKGEIGKLINHLTTNSLTRSKVTVTFEKPLD